ncbi:MAG: hypothetical protein SPG09_12200, partial [Lachnospiraceae bacterium]|nr:hypothetical protein [bacterium]MDY5518349.1 hypothetical protein [Lachnospiraceae bacterium]
MMIVISVSAVYVHVGISHQVQSMADAIKTSVYQDASDISAFLRSEDWDSVCISLMKSIDGQLNQSSLEITAEARTQIKDTLKELILSLNEQGMITFDSNGNLTELSKSYLANAAAYAVSFVIGESKIVRTDTIVSDLLSTKALDIAVKKIESTYAKAAGQISDKELIPVELSDMKTQLNILEKGLLNTSDNEQTISQLALRMAALETMITTLKNSPVSTVDYTKFSDETTKNFQQLKSELTSMSQKMNISKSDADGLSKNVTRLFENVNELSLKLKDFQQADVDQALLDLNREIVSREAAITALQEELDVLTSAHTSTTASIQSSVSGLQTGLATLQTDVSDLRSEQLAAMDKWKTEMNGNISSLQSNIDALRTTDSTTALALSSLNQSLNTVKVVINENDQTRANADAALQEQIHSSANTVLEQKAEEIEGVTIFAKLGALLKKLLYLSNHVDSSIAEEAASRESATQTLQNDIDTKVSDVRSAIERLQEALNRSDADNEQAIITAKAELEAALGSLNSALSGALTELDQKLSGDISDLDASLSESISEVDQSLSKDITDLNASLSKDISDSNQSLSKDISDLDQSLSKDISGLNESLSKDIADLNTSLSNDMSAMHDTLANDIAGLDQQTRENLASVLDTVNALQTALQAADKDLADDLSNAKKTLNAQLDTAQSTLSAQMEALDTSLSNSIRAEEQARAKADAALQAQIHSAENTELEQKAE